MLTFSNLKLWDVEKRRFEVRDIEVDYNPSLIKLNQNNIDCRDYLGVPLGVDAHVSFREPGYEYQEDILSGAEAALYGGVLTVLDMPNTKPITDSVETLKQKQIIARKQNVVDIKIAAAIHDRNIEKIKELSHYCDAFKIYITAPSEDLFIEEDKITLALSNLEDINSNKPVIFHAEDPNILKSKNKEISFYKRRPAEAEAVALQKILQWAKDFANLKFHVTHLSSSLSLRLLELSNISNLTSDTCPHYLFFNQFSDLDEEIKMVNPPLRQEFDNQALLQALSVGIIDMITSDHLPHTIEEKIQEKAIGVPGVQELLPVLFTLVHSGELEWERAIEAYHLFPSQLLNLTEKPISENLLIIDPFTPISVDSEWIKSKAGWSIFQNMMLYGSLKYVIKNSQLIIQIDN